LNASFTMLDTLDEFKIGGILPSNNSVQYSDDNVTWTTVTAADTNLTGSLQWFIRQNPLGPLVTNIQHSQSEMLSVDSYVFGDAMVGISGLFYDCIDLTGVADLDTSGIEDFETALFNSGITEAPQLNFLNAVTVSGLFRDCSSLTTVADIDFQSATDVSSVFASCSALNNIGSIVAVGATDISNILLNCSSITQVGITMGVGNIVDCSFTFSGCTLLECVGGYLDTTAASLTTDMFIGCTALLDPDGATQLLIEGGDTFTNTCP